MHLQGVGPKTVALLYRTLNISTLDELEAAARVGPPPRTPRDGREEAGADPQGARRAEAPRGPPPAGGHARRGVGRAREPAARIARTPSSSPSAACAAASETCGDLDILAIGGEPALIDAFVRNPVAERVLGRGDTKGSVLLRGGYQADLRLVPRESRGAALQYFTGSKAHNIVLRDLAMSRGWKLNEYGLFDNATGRPVAGETEEGIYEALGLAFVPPELRENRGEIEAAAERRLPRLVERADLRGDLHCHTTASDGRDTIEAMARAAQAAGLSYLAITDHSQALAMAGGLDEAAALRHAQRVRELSSRLDGFRLLAGIECDIRADGTLDLAEDCLAQLDVVVASVHSAFNMDAAQMTDRILRALECPYVDILGHPTGRLLLRREAYAVDIPRVIDAAATHGVALEINSQVDRHGPERSARATGQGARREAGDRLRLPLDRRLRHAALGRDRRPPRLADRRRRAEHAGRGGVPAGVAQEPR